MLATCRDITGGGNSGRTSVAGRVHLLPGSIRDDVRESWVISIHGRLRHRGRRSVSVLHTAPSIASLLTVYESYFWQGKLVPVYAIKARRWRTVINFEPRPLYPLYPGFAGLNVFEKTGENWYRGVKHRRRKQCALRNVGVTMHKTVTIVKDLNTLKHLSVGRVAQSV